VVFAACGKLATATPKPVEMHSPHGALAQPAS
jgi:hypothetical protein